MDSSEIANSQLAHRPEASSNNLPPKLAQAFSAAHLGAKLIGISISILASDCHRLPRLGLRVAKHLVDLRLRILRRGVNCKAEMRFAYANHFVNSEIAFAAHELLAVSAQVNRDVAAL